MSKGCKSFSCSWQNDENDGFSDKGHGSVQAACPVPMDKGLQRLKSVAVTMNLKPANHLSICVKHRYASLCFENLVRLTQRGRGPVKFCS